MTGKRGRGPVDPAIRFWRKINKTESCWVWMDHLNRDGYGRLRVGDRKVMAHRFSWMLAGNDVPEGMQLDHICLNRACVNPEHLRVATQHQNMQNLAGPQSRSATGARGVFLTPVKTSRGKRYKVYVGHHGESHYGGRFHTLEEAAEAARQLRLSLMTHNELDRRETA